MSHLEKHILNNKFGKNPQLKKEGSSHAALEKEKKAQGYPKDVAYQPSKSGGVLIRKNVMAKKMKPKKRYMEDLLKGMEPK